MCLLARSHMPVDLLVYSFTQKDIEKGAFMDLAKLTDTHVHSDDDVNVSIAIQTETMGTWFGKLQPCNDRAAVHLERCSDSKSLCSVHELTNFIRTNSSIGTCLKVLILSSHGCGWLLRNNKEGTPLFVNDIAAAIRASGVCFDVICLDCCLMATLEAACELHAVTKYVVACQNYGPWHGAISRGLIRNLIVNRNNHLQVCKSICDAFYDMNIRDHDNADPFDMSVIDPRCCMELYDAIKERVGASKDAMRYPTEQRIDAQWDVLYDLFALLEANCIFNASEQERFKRACVPYRVSSEDSPKTLNGISIAKFPNDDTSWAFTHTYLSSVTFPNPSSNCHY